MISKNWDIILKSEIDKEYFCNLKKFVDEEYKSKKIFPEKENLFNALRYTDYENVKVVILGQDPYHGDHQAHGLSFSVKESVATPPSLRNILKELENDLSISRKSGNLEGWAYQGVLLLNSIMTVVKAEPLSHKDKGWERFTDFIIQSLNDKEEPVVFVLWGNYARSKKVYITNSRHYIIESAHPSPLSASRGFFGSRPFSKINQFLEQNKLDKIDWEK